VRYLSDREVMMERELLPTRKGIRHYPERLKAANLTYAAFPAKFYQDKEPMLAALIKHGVLVSGPSIGTTVDGIRLAEVMVLTPPGDWTKASPPSPATTKPTTRKAKPTASTTHPTTSKAKSDTKRRAEKAQKLRKQRRLAAATQSTTRSSKKKKKHPTTEPATAPTTQPAQ
jgi:hypothetical protein